MKAFYIEMISIKHNERNCVRAERVTAPGEPKLGSENDLNAVLDVPSQNLEQNSCQWRHHSQVNIHKTQEKK